MYITKFHHTTNKKMYFYETADNMKGCIIQDQNIIKHENGRHIAI